MRDGSRQRRTAPAVRLKALPAGPTCVDENGERVPLYRVPARPLQVRLTPPQALSDLTETRHEEARAVDDDSDAVVPALNRDRVAVQVNAVAPVELV
jgi:hypothetical protein